MHPAVRAAACNESRGRRAQQSLQCAGGCEHPPDCALDRLLDRDARGATGYADRVAIASRVRLLGPLCAPTTQASVHRTAAGAPAAMTLVVAKAETGGGLRLDSLLVIYSYEYAVDILRCSRTSLLSLAMGAIGRSLR
mmetsp:Transcript_117762/g.358308  ORF Transcript_117762/g.358308 Transcript_117762/m.358308 type:complete len:138 (-) Transcript_117762:56-469(-)